MSISIAGWIDAFDSAPWSAAAGRRPAERAMVARSVAVAWPAPIYTAEQRRRRDATAWTMVQAVLAPVQFAAFLISLVLVVRFLATGQAYTAATASILVKTALLFAIMVTGSFWEKAVFGRWLFAPAFYWEDVFSFLVIGLHAAYVAALLTHSLAPSQMMVLALAAYAAYAINATQFVVKMRAARLAPGVIQAAE